MKVLAIDCATSVLSACVAEGSGSEAARVVSAISIDDGTAHVERLVAAVDSCLSLAKIAPADLGLLACTRGPGSFTGLRIGFSAVKGMSLALGIPFVSVPTLDCAAWRLRDRDGAVVPLIDARRARWYASIYEKGSRICGILDLPLAELVALANTYRDPVFTGPDAALAATREAIRIDPDHGAPLAPSLAMLALDEFRRAGAGPTDAGPDYARASEAEETRDAREKGTCP